MKFTMDCKFEQKSIDKIIKERNLEKGGRVQQVVDNEVIRQLGARVKRDTGAMESSIRATTVIGSGIVRVSTPYAKHQDNYDSGMNGLRGYRAFERMKADCKDDILRAAEKVR